MNILYTLRKKIIIGNAIYFIECKLSFCIYCTNTANVYGFVFVRTDRHKSFKFLHIKEVY